MGRRQITTAVTMLVLCGLLVVGAVVGWRTLFADLPGDKTAGDPPSCETRQIDAGQRIRSSQVHVSVYNAGDRSGLASSTMAALRKRGFKPGDVGNAPSDAKVTRVAVWSTEEGDAEARLVARQFGRKVKVAFSDVDLGPGVDVIVGDRFQGLANAKRSLRVRAPQDVCVPSGDESEGGSDGADTNAAPRR